MAWITGWSYRKSVTISRATGPVTNYQLKILVGESSGATGEDVDCGGLCLSSFDDLRFTTSGGETLLDYWIESVSGDAGNQLATVWVEFDSIGTGATTFYMYYGNAGASAVSNGDNTFPFFDDFSGSFPGAKWTGDTVYGSVASGIMTFAGNTASVEKTMRSASTVGATSGALRAKAKLYASSVSIFGIGSSHVGRFLYSGATKYFDTFNGGYSAATTNFTTAAYKIFDILVRAAVNVRFFEDASERTNSPKATNPPNDTMKVWVGLATASTLTSLDLDWVLLRQYPVSGVEPAWGSWGAQETSRPNFSPFPFPRLS